MTTLARSIRADADCVLAIYRPQTAAMLLAQLADLKTELLDLQGAFKGFKRSSERLAKWFVIEVSVAKRTGKFWLSVKPTQRFLDLATAAEAASGDLDRVHRPATAKGPSLFRGREHGSFLSTHRKRGKRGGKAR